MELRMWGEKPGVREKTKHRSRWGWSGARTSIHTVRVEGENCVWGCRYKACKHGNN